MTPPPTVTYAGAQVKRRPGRGALGVAAGGGAAASPPSDAAENECAVANERKDDAVAVVRADPADAKSSLAQEGVRGGGAAQKQAQRRIFLVFERALGSCGSGGGMWARLAGLRVGIGRRPPLVARQAPGRRPGRGCAPSFL